MLAWFRGRCGSGAPAFDARGGTAALAKRSSAGRWLVLLCLASATSGKTLLSPLYLRAIEHKAAHAGLVNKRTGWARGGVSGGARWLPRGALRLAQFAGIPKTWYSCSLTTPLAAPILGGGNAKTLSTGCYCGPKAAFWDARVSACFIMQASLLVARLHQSTGAKLLPELAPTMADTAYGAYAVGGGECKRQPLLGFLQD